MHPDLDEFLERILACVQPISNSVGRVVVEPDYDTQPEERDASALAKQLTECIAAQAGLAEPIASPQGREVPIGAEYPLLKRYLRRIMLHSDTVEGAWVEVAPPGNWI